MKINICLSADNNYVQHLGVTIVSILLNAKRSDELFFYILDGGITDENKTNLLNLKMVRSFSIEYFKINNDIIDKFVLTSNYISKVTYYRYYIGVLLPKLEKIIYLDSDTIVNDSLSELYNTEIRDCYIAGVEDVGYSHHRMYDKRLHYNFFYINAGVLLINIKKWNEDGIHEKLINYTCRNGEKIRMCFDQDVLNAVLHKKCMHLEYKWNVQDSFYRFNEEVSTNENKCNIIKSSINPSIIHFTGHIKPWSNYEKHPMSHLYLKYLRHTSWRHNLPCNSFIRVKQMIRRIALFSRWLAYNLVCNFKKNLTKEDVASEAP